MKHLGDITSICGADITPVDCIVGGSPCQDLSVAGKREGLAGARSGLFIEQVRIVKEMREHDRANGRTVEFCRPRFLVWENVPGALSSGTPKGEDFRIVLEEIARVIDPNAVIPRPANGKWTNAGCIILNGGALLGAYTMHSFGEQPSTLMAECGMPELPSGVGVSRLSRILVDTPLPKYYLSEKACLGILNRAKRRGKDLPKELKDALENQASQSKLGGGVK